MGANNITWNKREIFDNEVGKTTGGKAGLWIQLYQAEGDRKLDFKQRLRHAAARFSPALEEYESHLESANHFEVWQGHPEGCRVLASEKLLHLRALGSSSLRVRQE